LSAPTSTRPGRPAVIQLAISALSSEGWISGASMKALRTLSLFTVAGATAYADDVLKAEIHILGAGHFALDEATDQIASLVRNFLERLARFQN